MGVLAPSLSMNSTALRRIRALEILRRRTSFNQTNVQIAAAMGVHEDTVARELKWAENIGLLEQAKDEIIASLAGAVVTRLQHEVTDLTTKRGGEIALKIAESLGMLRDPGMETPQEAASGMEQWLKRRAQREEEPAIDAEFHEQRQLADGPEPSTPGADPLPPGTAGRVPPGVDGHDGAPAAPEGAPADRQADVPADDAHDEDPGDCG